MNRIEYAHTLSIQLTLCIYNLLIFFNLLIQLQYSLLELYYIITQRAEILSLFLHYYRAKTKKNMFHNKGRYSTKGGHMPEAEALNI